MTNTRNTLGPFMPSRRTIGAAAIVALLTAVAATADEEHAHADISPTVDSGEIITNGFVDGDGDFLIGQRVFAYELGENAAPGNESFAGDPGVNIQPGSGFSGLPGLRIVGPLTYWDADPGGDATFDVSDVSFATVTDPAVFLRISFGAQQRDITGTTGTLADIFLKSTHEHFNALLTDTSGAHLDSVTDPPAGIYQFEAQVVSTDGSLTPSESISINFNYGADEEAHEASIQWTEQNLVPEPGSLALLALGALATCRRRK